MDSLKNNTRDELIENLWHVPLDHPLVIFLSSHLMSDSMDYPFLLSALQSHAQTDGDQAFLRKLEEESNITVELTFFNLQSKVRSLANNLLSNHHVSVGDSVLVVYSEPSQLIVGLLACMSVGAISGIGCYRSLSLSLSPPV